MGRHLRDIGEQHWIGDPYERGGWRRYTLFHIQRHRGGASTSWPIAEIDIVDHPSRDGAHPHAEVKISLRNDIRRTASGIDVDKNTSRLRHVADIVAPSVLEASIDALKELGAISTPFSVWTCIRHVEGFRVEGDFWSQD